MKYIAVVFCTDRGYGLSDEESPPFDTFDAAEEWGDEYTRDSQVLDYTIEERAA